MNFVAAVRSFLARFDVAVKRFEFPNDPPIALLPILVESLLPSHGDFFALQIGANDGHSDDPIAGIVRAHRLSALMVEPMPLQFELLRAFYRDQPQVACENCAIAHQDGVVTLYWVRPDQSLPNYVQRVA